MKFIKYFCLMVFMFSVSAFSQVEFSFSGYAVDLPVYTATNQTLSKLMSIDESQFINLTRLRLRPEVFLWANSRISMEYEIDGTYAKKGFLFDLNSVNTSRQYFHWNWEIEKGDNYSLTHYIDRLYFRQGFDWGNIIIGRQRISWGTGRVWNPTDLFNPINPANFSKIEKDGADVVSFTYAFGNFTDLNIVYNPQKESENSNAGFRFRTNFAEYDFSVVGGYFDRRVVAGMDFAGNLFEAGVRGEGIISMDKENLNNNFVKLIFGMDNQFTPKLYGLFEYHYNGEGKTKKYRYQLNRLISGKILNLGQNYLFTSITYQLTPLLTGTLSNNINFNDGSGYTGLQTSYSVTGDFYVNFGVQLTYGTEFSEYWYYPNSFYLQGEYYF